MAGFGGSIKLTGEAEYRRALQKIAQDLQSVSKTLQTQTSEFNSNDRAVKDSAEAKKQLNDVINKQQQIINTAKNTLSGYTVEMQRQTTLHNQLNKEYKNAVLELERVKKASGENSDEYKKQTKAVEELEKALIDSQIKLDDTKTAMSSYKSEINKAQKEVISAQKEIDKLGNEVEESGKKAEDSKDGWSSWGQTLADLRTNVIENVVSSLNKIGSKLIDTGKQALENYSTFEQLKGGIESMFGGTEKGAEQINKVLELSNSAWQDLTMSQNDYMQTFSSTYPLMKNDIEDQNEAIEKTQQLMTLNSDLANTYGYSMETASNAVNWALKGTFSYLDNLNLGIKGTKEGFLEAAQSVGYTVDSVDELTSSDILDILQKYADKYGVLGKTSAEASTTIEGSTKAMKAAWQNLLTGFADGNSDFGELINNFVESLSNAAENIMPRIEEIIKSFMSIIPTLIPEFVKLGSSLISNLVQGIKEAIPQVISTITELIPNMINSIISFIPKVIKTGMEILESLIQGIINAIPDLIKMLPTIIDTLVTELTQGLPEIIDMGINILLSLVDGIVNAIPQLIEQMPVIISEMLNTITKNLPRIISMGTEILVKLTLGIVNAIPQLVGKIPEIVKSFINGFGSFIKNDLPDLGKNIIKGILQGLTNCGQFITSAVKEVGSKIKNGIKNFFGIKSPSTVMRDEVGTFLAEGIGVGFTNEMENVTKDMQKAIPTSFDTTINAGVNEINGMTSINKFDNLVLAFKEALSEMKIELDDEVAGKFVENTVARAVYS